MAAEVKLGEKSRREARKEARLSKNKKKFDSWVEHQKSRRSNKALSDPKSTGLDEFQDLSTQVSEGKEVASTNLNYEGDLILEQPTSHSSRLPDSSKPEVVKRNKGVKKNLKSKFQEYLEMDIQGGVLSAEADLELEKKLAKKLKVKKGKLGGVDDEISMLLEGIPSILDSTPEETISHREKHSHRKIESSERDLGDGMASDEVVEFPEPVESCSGGDHKSHRPHKLKKAKIKSDSSKDVDSNALKAEKRKKTKFDEYLEMDMAKGVASADEDLNLERKLAKKLKVKEGKLGGAEDDFNIMLEGIPTVLSNVGNEDILAEEAPSKSLENRSSREKKAKKMKSSEQVPEVEMPVRKYVAPHLRHRGGSESEEHAQLRRRVRGLLNRLSESNVESITAEMSTLFRSVGHPISSQIISEEVVASCSGGPRGNEQYAAVFAAFVAGMACLVGIDFGAKILASLAKCFEDEYLEEDNLSLRNLTLLLSYLYIFGVCSSDLIYDFMIMLSKRLLEIDVSTILTILQCCGMKLRSDDPAAMKNFILSVQDRVKELKASSENGQRITSSKRMKFMLETICDIKNNKKKTKEDSVQHTRMKKWLQKLRVEDVLIRGLKWSSLIDPDKKGQWWLSGDMASTTDNVEEVASTIDREALEAQKMLQLAASQRMNTDARKAIFCILMSGEDYIDTFEKLLRLDLPGKQDREIMRVLVECCLQEKVFNKYYTVLATKLCSHDKNHKFTLQYCLWDHFKDLESMQLIRSMHLSKFVVEMLASFWLSLSVLKVVDLSDATQLTPKRILHFRLLFEAIFELSDGLVWNIFTRVAVTPENESLRNGIEFFINKYVVGTKKSFSQKFKVAKKAFSNVEGVIL